jgi:Flp pilus assembly pilin Flp
MTHFMCTLQTLGLKVQDGLRSRRENREAGQTAAEYMGIIVIVAIIIAAIAGSGVGDTIAGDITKKIGSIFAGTK